MAFLRGLFFGAVVSCAGVTGAQQADTCPMVLAVQANGQVIRYQNGWFRISQKTLETYLHGGCYPEGGPRPTSSVKLEILPGAPQAQVQTVYRTLERAGWNQDRITVERRADLMPRR